MPNRVKSKIIANSKERIEIERFSDDFSVRAAVDLSGKPLRTKSGRAFIDSLLNGMGKFGAEIIVARDVAETKKIIHNSGYAFGEALRKAYEKKKAKESGMAIYAKDKAMCMCAINAKKQAGEANLQIIGKPDFDAEHFFAFFDGLAQGFEAEINVLIKIPDIKKSGHADFLAKAFSSCLEQIISMQI